MVIGAPQPEQKLRSAMSDSFRILRVSEWLNERASFGTCVNGRKAEPDTCWHARQWHSVMSDGAALDVYCTPPQRHPPLKTTSCLMAGLMYLEPSAAACGQFISSQPGNVGHLRRRAIPRNTESTSSTLPSMASFSHSSLYMP